MYSAVVMLWNYCSFSKDAVLHQIFIAIELYPSDVWGPYTWFRNSTDDEVGNVF